MASELTQSKRWMVLIVAIGSLLFDGMELGMMPVASISLTRDLLGEGYTKQLGGDWFAALTAALMLGAAMGGIALGSLGDAIGRARALGVSVLFYSIFAGLGGWVTTLDQMLVLRFLVGLGVGGVWPNAVALASECWPNKSRPAVAGLLGAALNLGILILSQIVLYWSVTPDSWRWLFFLAAIPTVLGLGILGFLPESPKWLETSRSPQKSTSVASRIVVMELFSKELLRTTIVGIVLGSIPLIGAWAASKWMIPWADVVASDTHPGYKAMTQGYWSLGAVLGSFFGAQIASWLGRRLAYSLMSLGSTSITMLLFLATEPLQAWFLPLVFAQGFVATLFFGWLPLYLPELFPTRVRSTGTGVSYNIGRFATAIAVFAAGKLFLALDGSYVYVGAICSLVYLFGLAAIPFAPDTTKRTLEH
ncbi:MAG: MFS transporter [Pirellulales bacterium]